MPQFQVVEGRQSAYYNHFKDYKFEGATATNTRLMGVVALKLSWRARNSREHLYQLMHLDFSEYGIDEYMEYFTDPDMSDFSMIVSKSQFKDAWNRISGSLGGSEVRITLGNALRLIHMSLAINEGHYRDHNSSIQEFRKQTLRRINLMKEAVESDFPDDLNLDEYPAMAAVCPKSLSIYETINYFIMRLCDEDYSAAAFLSDMTEAELSRIPVWTHQMMTLTSCRIRRSDTADHYLCTILAEGDTQYYYMRAEAAMDFRAGKRNSRVAGFKCSYCHRASEYEAAMLTRRSEYITVYSISSELTNFDLDQSSMAADALMSSVPNGILYTLYNSDNSHVDTDRYYIGSDLYGAFLVTPSGELVIASSELVKITMMEMNLASSFFNGELELEGRYRFGAQVFQTFCEMSGARFEDILQ